MYYYVCMYLRALVRIYEMSVSVYAHHVYVFVGRVVHGMRRGLWSRFTSKTRIHTYKHTHTYTHTNPFIDVCVCVCVFDL